MFRNLIKLPGAVPSGKQHLFNITLVTGKSSVNGPLSIAMLVYWEVSQMIQNIPPLLIATLLHCFVVHCRKQTYKCINVEKRCINVEKPWKATICRSGNHGFWWHLCYTSPQDSAAKTGLAKHPMVRANERMYSSLSEKIVRTFLGDCFNEIVTREIWWFYSYPLVRNYGKIHVLYIIYIYII